MKALNTESDAAAFGDRCIRSGAHRGDGALDIERLYTQYRVAAFGGRG